MNRRNYYKPIHNAGLGWLPSASLPDLFFTGYTKNMKGLELKEVVVIAKKLGWDPANALNELEELTPREALMISQMLQVIAMRDLEL
jgi:hypothetical protein